MKVPEYIKRTMESHDDSWSPMWQPKEYMLDWFRKLLSTMKDGAIWGIPGVGLVYRIDKSNKTLTLIEGDPHDSRHWHDKNVKTLAALGWKVDVKLESAGSLNLQAELGNLIKHPRSGVLFLSTGLGYAVDEQARIMILMSGKPDAEHERVTAFMQAHGWTVLDGWTWKGPKAGPKAGPKDDDNPDEMSFAESIRSELYEEAASPFSKGEATLQYRPFRLNGGWQWAWVLLPDDRNKALAHGQGSNRAVAAVEARKNARKLGVTINQIDVIRPHE